MAVALALWLVVFTTELGIEMVSIPDSFKFREKKFAVYWHSEVVVFDRNIHRTLPRYVSQ